MLTATQAGTVFAITPAVATVNLISNPLSLFHAPSEQEARQIRQVYGFHGQAAATLSAFSFPSLLKGGVKAIQKPTVQEPIIRISSDILSQQSKLGEIDLGKVSGIADIRVLKETKGSPELKLIKEGQAFISGEVSTKPVSEIQALQETVGDIKIQFPKEKPIIAEIKSKGLLQQTETATILESVQAGKVIIKGRETPFKSRESILKSIESEKEIKAVSFNVGANELSKIPRNLMSGISTLKVTSQPLIKHRPSFLQPAEISKTPLSRTFEPSYIKIPEFIPERKLRPDIVPVPEFIAERPVLLLPRPAIRFVPVSSSTFTEAIRNIVETDLSSPSKSAVRLVGFPELTKGKERIFSMQSERQALK